MSPTVAIDCFHEHLPPGARDATIVAIDVIRATTTAITAVVAGWRCFVAGSIEAAVPLAARLADPVLAGELGGNQPYGFHLQNSPVAVADGAGHQRPLVLLSTSGTRLMAEAGHGEHAYAACLRNTSATARVLIGRGAPVMLLGADSRGEFREEDQLCAARIASALVQQGFEPADQSTARVIEQWSGAPDEAFLDGRSARYLRDTGQDADLDFVLGHVDDLNAVFPVTGDEIRMAPLP